MSFQNENHINVLSAGRNKKLSVTEDSVITPNLIEQLRSGSQQAFKTIYIHYYGSLEKFLFALLRSKQEAEEMAQDVFMKVWEKRESLDPSQNIKSFIYTVARNAALNLFDHRKVVDRHSRTAEFSLNEETTSEDILIARETELLIKIVVGRMPKIRRMIFELHHYDNMDNSAIAERLGISKTNVANHIALARKDIKKVIYLFFVFILQ